MEKAVQKRRMTQSSTAVLLRHLLKAKGMFPPLFWFGVLRSADGITSSPRRIALSSGGHTARGIGTLGVLTEPILSVRSVPAAAPALWERAVRAAVIVIAARRPSHETFKSPMIAMGKIHGIPPFIGEFGLCGVYMKKSVSW